MIKLLILTLVAAVLVVAVPPPNSWTPAPPVPDWGDGYGGGGRPDTYRGEEDAFYGGRNEAQVLNDNYEKRDAQQTGKWMGQTITNPTLGST